MTQQNTIKLDQNALSILELYNFYEKFTKQKLEKGPSVVEIEVTNLCNLRCNMCSRWTWTLQRPSLKGSLTTENLTEFFDNLKKIGTKIIILSGGEPLCREDFLELISYLYKIGMKYAVFTNGTLLSQEIAKEIIRTKGYISISIDGFATHDKIRGVDGALNKILQGINYLIENSHEDDLSRIEANCTIQKHNVKDIALNLEKMDEIHFNYMRFALGHFPADMSFGREEMEALKILCEKIRKKKMRTKMDMSPYVEALINGQIPLKQLKKGILARNFFEKDPVPCFACYTFSLVDAFGDVYPCTYIYLDQQPYDEFLNYRKHVCLGNILKDDFQVIWNGEKYNNFRKETNPVDVNKYPMACELCEGYFQFKQIRDAFRCFDFLKSCGRGVMYFSSGEYWID